MNKTSLKKSALRFLLWLVLVTIVAVPAQARVYVYTGNNPMAKMMLDFMEVMGFIRRLPDQYAANLIARNRGWSGFPTSNLWGVSPYTGMASLAAPMAMSSMLSQPGMGGWPGMGNMATMPWSANSMGSMPYAGLNNMTPPLASISPPADNGKIEMTVEELQRLLGERRQGTGISAQDTSQSQPDIHAGTGKAVSGNRPKAASTSRVKMDALTGLWMGKNRDILTITGNRFIWTDPQGRITKGTFRLDGDTMLVQAEGAKAPAIYKVQYLGNKMVATNKAGFNYEFTRSQVKQPR